MRLIKMLGLAAFCALAATAFIGAASASAAAHDKLGLCKAEELLLCKTANLIAVGSGTLLGKATNPTLSGTLTETCEVGHIEGTITSPLDPVGKLIGSISSVTFTGCKPCTTVTVENLPYESELTMTTTLGSDWVLNTRKPAGVIKATLSKCVLGAGTCIFKANEINALVEMAAGVATVNTNKAPLEFAGGTLGEGFCGKVGAWEAKYALSFKLTADGVVHNAVPTLLGEA
jgi:hypothetical protein